MTAAAFDRQLLRTIRRRTSAAALVPLAPMTTFKVGGPADWLIDASRRGRDCGTCSPLPTLMASASPCWAAAPTCSFPMLESEAWSCGCAAVTSRGLPMIGSARTRGVTINGLVRWTLSARSRRPRGVGRHAGNGRRSDVTATRIFAAG